MTEIPYRQEVTYEDNALNDDEKLLLKTISANVQKH